MQVTITITGLDEAKERAQLAKELVLQYTHDDLEAFGVVTTEQMKRNHPPGGPHPPAGQMPVFGQHAYIDRTGRLTASIGYHVEGWSNFKALIVVFAAESYAQAVEEGTYRSRPYPFFYPVFYANVPMLMEKLAQATYLALAEAARR